MSLYRWFKTQVYWSIPSIFRNTNPNDFIGDKDLVTIYKHTEDSNVYENRKVTLDQLAGLIGGGTYKEVFFRTTYSSGIQYGFSTLTTNNLSIYSYEAGRFILTINNANDRPSSVYKIEVNADVAGGYGLADDVWRVAVDASAASITGEIVFYTYKYNTTTNVFQLANPISAWHPVHIRIYS